ncbi:MAG: 16S rRNA (guanine(966)-N(2))-methyltransferase RsmD [Acidobacteria bacterium]|nr:16S rRNA (guanine(966)-N(2))-methyltransferase RsmD [Acidobacteriota bacterium]
MRVISGKYRSRPLRSLRGLEIRPTSDRLRETLFNVLTAGNPRALEGSVWLDLFAGTGAVGIEALSRGASQVYFVESAAAAAALIRENLSSLGVDSGFAVMKKDVVQALPHWAESHADFVFLDPPYRQQEIYGQTLEGLEKLLRSGGLVIAEHDKRFDPGDRVGRFSRKRKLQQGDAVLSFYQLD